MNKKSTESEHSPNREHRIAQNRPEKSCTNFNVANNYTTICLIRFSATNILLKLKTHEK